MPPEDMSRQATVHDVRTRALAAGFALDAERAAALVPICNALAEADGRLHALPLADSAATGPPWGWAERDGGR